jgi:hypothetical protein
MALALVVLALGCLIAATFLWQRTKKLEGAGAGTRRTRIAITVLVVAGIALALGSQLPMFQA